MMLQILRRLNRNTLLDRKYMSSVASALSQSALEAEIALTKRKNLLKRAAAIDKLLILPPDDDNDEQIRVMNVDDKALAASKRTPFLMPDDIVLPEVPKIPKKTTENSSPEIPIISCNASGDPNTPTLWKSWGEYFAFRGYEGEIKLDEKDRTLMQKVTAALTCPLTLHSAIQNLPTTVLDKKHLVIYVLGAASQEESLIRNFWPELGAMMPDVFFEFVLIGPDLSEDTKANPIIQINDKITAAFMKSDYMTFHNEVRANLDKDTGSDSTVEKKMKPDLYVAFNAGLKLDEVMWKDTIETILNEEVPLFATANCLEDVKGDGEFLYDIGAHFTDSFSDSKDELKKGRVNPFSAQLFEKHSGRIARSNAYTLTVCGFSQEKYDNTLGRSLNIS